MATTNTDAGRKKKGYFQRFTAVDLIVIAVFALLLRFVFLYIYKALYVVFPWNQAISPLFWSFCMATMLALVPKPGATLLWTIVWMLINFFLQGEDPIYAIGFMWVPFVTEFVFWLMKRYGGDLVSSIIGTSAYIAGSTIWNWIALNYVFLMPYSLGLGLAVFAISVFVTSPIGAFLGYQLGSRLKTLLG